MRVTLLATLAGLMASIAHLGGRSYRYWYRHHRDMYHVYNPYAALSGTLRYLKRDVFAPPSRRALIPVARDAVLGPANQAGRKRLLVLVVGETARAQNFSLGGYARDTNPQMRRRGAYYFADTWACGTTTAVSVPCMFSGLTQSGFDKADPVEHWNLLDVVQHAGVDVLWRDNDGGCQGVCARVPNEDLTHATLGKLCDDHGCRDDVLVDDLPKQLAKLGPPRLFSPLPRVVAAICAGMRYRRSAHLHVSTGAQHLRQHHPVHRLSAGARGGWTANPAGRHRHRNAVRVRPR
jgi:lipid A ethanolaminephosphotransferase